MSDLIHLTIDGRAVTAAPGTLVINAAKQVGIEVPSFCYYDGLSLQAACRMCLVEVEKTPKLQVAARCRWPKAWWSTPIRRKCMRRAKARSNFC
jgi:predicted molibdopterin-dependent oxidoreductase YjgC